MFQIMPRPLQVPGKEEDHDPNGHRREQHGSQEQHAPREASVRHDPNSQWQSSASVP